MRTRLTDLLEIDHPITPARMGGMGAVSYHRLVAAVSEAGEVACTIDDAERILARLSPAR